MRLTAGRDSELLRLLRGCDEGSRMEALMAFVPDLGDALVPDLAEGFARAVAPGVAALPDSPAEFRLAAIDGYISQAQYVQVLRAWKENVRAASLRLRLRVNRLYIFNPGTPDLYERRLPRSTIFAVGDRVDVAGSRDSKDVALTVEYMGSSRHGEPVVHFEEIAVWTPQLHSQLLSAGWVPFYSNNEDMEYFDPDSL